jgi:hypothetical protein
VCVCVCVRVCVCVCSSTQVKTNVKRTYRGTSVSKTSLAAYAVRFNAHVVVYAPERRPT